jgi:uncharacterized protein (TIGR04141 family)
MAAEARLQHLSIFLIKPSYKTFDQVLVLDACEKPVEISIAGHGAGRLYVKRNPPSPPRWAEFFSEFLDPAQLLVAGVSAAVVIEVHHRLYVLAFGQGGRYLMRPDVYEERFGLLCTLNSVSSDTLRCVDVQSLNAIQSHSRIQAGQESSPDQFGLDVEQDMLRAVVGAPKDPALGGRMSGSDSLSVAVKAKLADLPSLLDNYRKNFEENIAGKAYEWVNNISLTKSAEQIAKLEAALDARLAKGDLANIWLAVPEIIDWDEVYGFIFSHGPAQAHTDISMAGFLKTFQAGERVSLQSMKERRVYCADADYRRTRKDWSVFRCLYAEIELDGDKYILNDGSWFKVAIEFVQKTNDDFKRISYSKLALPEYADDSEGVYNARVAAALPDQFFLLDDTQKIMHGGGHGQVEVCDLFSIDREFIHIKMYGKSSVFSHLFAQGFVSGQLIQTDADFRKKVRAKLKAPFQGLISAAEKPAQGAFKVVYGVISAEPGQDLHLPFFSRVNLNNTARILKGFGFEVELLKIRVDPIYSKTAKIPSKGRKKTQ